MELYLTKLKYKTVQTFKSFAVLSIGFYAEVPGADPGFSVGGGGGTNVRLHYLIVIIV